MPVEPAPKRHHQPAERPRQGDPRARDAQGAQGDGAVRGRGHVDPHHRARQRLRAADARLSRRLSCERDGARARRMGAGSRRRMPRGVGGRARQARVEGQSAEHARRVQAALGRAARRREGRPREAYGSRWRRCATPATSAPSSARPTRSARAGIILIGSSCDPYSRECVRATMGSVFAVPLVAHDREAFLAWVKGLPGRRRRHAPRCGGGFPQGEVSRARRCC